MTCGKRLVDGGSFGHSVHSGRWHGDAVVHVFAAGQVRQYLRQVRSLTQVRHENLVLYMGAAALDGGPYCIVTNPVRAESLHSRCVLFMWYNTLLSWLSDPSRVANCRKLLG